MEVIYTFCSPSFVQQIAMEMHETAPLLPVLLNNVRVEAKYTRTSHTKTFKHL